uniref:Uncharacterized protein n=1 Tax=Anopheles dirus TaxID=7168 RepID=A0A182NH77_9DIPT
MVEPIVSLSANRSHVVHTDRKTVIARNWDDNKLQHKTFHVTLHGTTATEEC